MIYQRNVKIKIFLAILLSLFLYFTLYMFQYNYLADKLCLNFESNEKICLDKSDLFYDKKSDIYYYPIDKSYLDKKYYFSVKRKNFEEFYINKNLISNKKYKIDYENTINYQVKKDEQEIININIKFTNLPIINIQLVGLINDSYQEAIFEIYGPYGSSERDLFTKKILIRNRGTTSIKFDKKSYRIEFSSSKRNNIIEENSPLKDTEDWALDALYSDPSKIRNKLGTDIWNFINSINNNLAYNMNVIFTELYLNNEYVGLYTVKDLITRKKLNLKQTTYEDSSIIVKGINYIPVEWEEKNFNISTEVYNSLEMKYPNNSKYYSKYWPVILDKLTNYYETKENYFENILKTFEADNFLDFKVFSELIAAVDHFFIKNTYFAMPNKDSNVSIIPWDMDLTFGLIYNGDTELRSEKKSDYINVPMDYHNFEGDSDYLKAFKERYFYLRKNGLSKEYIINLIDDYVEDIYYASLRDSDRWYEYDIIKETEEIKDWVSKRFDYLDKKFKGL